MQMINLKRLRIPSYNLIRRAFAEVVPSKGETTVTSKPQEILNEISKVNLGLSAEEFLVAKNTGTDLYLTPEKMRGVATAGFFFEDVNDKIDLDSVACKGLKLQYLKNMLLLQDYNSIFRDFLQSIAQQNTNGLGLTCEPRFKQYLEGNIMTINRLGLNIELESLKILHEYKVLRVEIYKNLHVNRDQNNAYHKYNFAKVPTPLGPLVIAHEKGNDHSIAKDQKPFILATTMLVKSPMKMAIYNQNLTRKLHGHEQDEKINYVVRFESQFSYSDFAWVLPTMNKPKRLRSTKITDFNNIMRGNPYFEDKLDLVNDIDRYKYMSRNENADNNIRNFISASKI